MTIGPEGGSLILDAKVLNKDAGFVTQGQSVAVKLEAFPFTRYGAIPGTVERIGSDAIEDEKLGLVYPIRSEEHTSELQSLMRISYAVFCLKKNIIEYQYETKH